MKDSPVTDNNDLAHFGYRQELKRSLGSFSSFAAGFSYISILTGLFQMFYLGYGVAGPGFFWTWPFVLAGQLLVALCFAELASRFPLSGGVYQWAKFTGNPFLGWMTGWIYLACLIVTIAAVAMALQVSLPQISKSFQLIGTSNDPKSVAMNAILLGSILIVISTIINARGIKLLALVNNIGVFAELVGIIFLIVLLFLNRVRSPVEAVVHIKYTGSGFKSFPDVTILMAATALTASYVLYGFDTAGTLAEETHDPRKKAPRAILQALLAAGFAGLLVLLFALMAVPDLDMPDLGNINGGLPMLVKSVLGETAGSLFLCIVIFAISVCTFAVQSGSVRLMFAMGRDGYLPFSKSLSEVSSKTQTPVLATLLCGLGAIIILAMNLQFPKVFELVTSIAILWANLAYWIVVALQLKNRIKLARYGGDADARFKLGKWGFPVNILALIWSSFMVINVSWPRTATYGEGWHNQYAAWIYTVALLGLGVFIYYYKSIKRKEFLNKNMVYTQFIDGALTTSSNRETWINYNPANNNPLGEVCQANDQDIEAAVNSSEKAFHIWRTKTGAERGRVLVKAAHILRSGLEKIALLETQDVGKPISESLAVDITSAADALEYFGGMAAGIHGEFFDLKNAFGYTRPEPLGICAGIGAWNYPIQIAAWKAAPALACGNSMIFKPSELTPATALELAKAFMDAGAPPGLFNVVQGDARVGSKLVAHPRIAKISLTGSVSTGKKIFTAAATQLKRVTLELGGKSPLIIFEDADIHNAVSAALLANFYTQGEVCSNGTRVFVHRQIFDSFLMKLKERTEKIRLGDPSDPDTQMGALISKAHMEKVIRFIDSGKSSGATLLTGGFRPEKDFKGRDITSGNFLAPAIFTDCDDAMEICKEEIFGPVLSILCFDAEEEVIERANNTPYGLAAGVFTNDIKRGHRVIHQLQAGTCWINNYNITPVELPFGGYKQSGVGRENSLAAIQQYTQLKSVYVELGNVESPY